MKPTERLTEEHRGIKLMLSILESMCHRLQAGEKINPQHLEQVIDFFKDFAGKCHHAKEETLLFPAVEKVGFSKEFGPLAVMLKEHTAGRNYIREMTEAAASYKSGVSDSTNKFIKAARRYITLLREHIETEDQVLFPMADAQLSESVQNELIKGFDRVETEIIGVGKHEEYHLLMKNLKAIYLP